MRRKTVHSESASERIVKDIRRATRKRHSAEEKIRIVLDGLRGECSIAELCQRIAESLYYAWSKVEKAVAPVADLEKRVGLYDLRQFTPKT